MMKRTFPVILAVVIALGALFPVILQAGSASACHQGLTPGYWKNHTASWVGDHSPSCYFDEVFGVGPHQTLLQVLKTGGGGEKALGRHAVAALLNAYRFAPDWYSPGWVIGRVQYAYSSGNFEAVKNQLEALNELGD